MRELLHSETARVTFSVADGTPDSLPTAGCYAGSTLLGAATVNALTGVRDYEIIYALPSSGIAPYTVISFRVNAVVNAVALPTTHLVAGELVAARRNTIEPDNYQIGVAAEEAMSAAQRALIASNSATTAASQATLAASRAADIQSRIPTALDSGRMITKAEVVSGTVTLATAQPNYAPAKAGDAMTLTSQERSDIANAIQPDINNVADLIGEPTGASIAADIAAIDNSGGGDATAENQTEILNKLTQLLNIFKGIDLLRRFLRGG